MFFVVLPSRWWYRHIIQHWRRMTFTSLCARLKGIPHVTAVCIYNTIGTMKSGSGDNSCINNNILFTSVMRSLTSPISKIFKIKIDEDLYTCLRQGVDTVVGHEASSGRVFIVYKKYPVIVVLLGNSGLDGSYLGHVKNIISDLFENDINIHNNTNTDRYRG